MSKKNTIDLSTAQAWTKKWRDSQKTQLKAKSFLIPKENFIGLLEQDVDAVRAYIGVDEKDEEKLMLVGTKHDPKTGIYKDMTPGGELEGAIFDFTKPCPPGCDPDTPVDKDDDKGGDEDKVDTV